MPLIRNINDVPRVPAKMPGAERVTMAIMVGRADGAPNFALRQFNVEPGGCTPRHSHDYEHEVYILEGRGTILLEGRENPIKAGDVIYVPAEQEHQFKPAPESNLRFLCLVPATRNCGDPTPGS